MDMLKAIWNSPFWDEPISAFVVPVIVIGYFIFTEWRERRTLRLSRKAFADGWGPKKNARFRHKWFPFMTCRVDFYSNSPNDKFTPSVFVQRNGGRYVEMPACVLRYRYSEIKE
ncbi:hypothetical protein MPK70_gp043 [Erwinia phage pEa_SNUABM_33]|uniref:Uncharacterized protein n=1 Tax=Erwinia phage pEa_SNUABM_33 TaxID=2869556 RepID=A0AAE7XMX1_9CAUD|nr:hypothetical protein MPK70_gp043 [Erwinia phage pEa_SNUABM_33]QZE57919.1 hypothetical protein pEaSNUABM33_00043 [Erwinia phage pEa_SNUABM_33]WAK44424.1 hypothetical protein [Erwinia phage vB_Ea_2910A]